MHLDYHFNLVYKVNQLRNWLHSTNMSIL